MYIISIISLSKRASQNIQLANSTINEFHHIDEILQQTSLLNFESLKLSDVFQKWYN